MTVVRALWHLFAVVGLATAIGGVWFAAQGVGAIATPGALETALARTARHYLVPAALRARTNPVPSTAESLAEGKAHWADHCASCHGNDGAGDTPMGRGLYPKAPDMRLAATQGLSDGELFALIEHGVKLTGMPAWTTGTPEGEQATWRLVRFIRQLPALTDDDLLEMEDRNPRGRAEWRALEEERKFLSGTLDVPEPLPGHPH
ncbi:MAG: c-type cytochrome [Acidobacteria bacterium]|nr:c-type cytochrome [Acidobacteriota bacterium]